MIVLLVLLWDHVLAFQSDLTVFSPLENARFKELLNLAEIGVVLGDLGLKLVNLVLVFVNLIKKLLMDLFTKSLLFHFGLMPGLVILMTDLIHLLSQDLNGLIFLE